MRKKNRSEKRTAQTALKIACGLVDEGMIEDITMFALRYRGSGR